MIHDCHSKIHKLLTVSFPVDEDDDKGEDDYKPEADNDEELGEGKDINIDNTKVKRMLLTCLPRRRASPLYTPAL